MRERRGGGRKEGWRERDAEMKRGMLKMEGWNEEMKR